MTPGLQDAGMLGTGIISSSSKIVLNNTLLHLSQAAHVGATTDILYTLRLLVWLFCTAESTRTSSSVLPSSVPLFTRYPFSEPLVQTPRQLFFLSLSLWIVLLLPIRSQLVLWCRVGSSGRPDHDLKNAKLLKLGAKNLVQF